MPSSPLASWAWTAGVNVDASRSRLSRTDSNGDERSFIRRAHCPTRIRDPAGNNGRRAPHRRCAAPHLWTSLFRRRGSTMQRSAAATQRSGRREAISSTGERVQEENHGGHEIKSQEKDAFEPV